jgi:RNA polymerase sigma-70 factor (ECF subfamily)
MVTSDAGARAAEGPTEQAEFDVLFLSHYQSVYRVLYRIVGSSDEAEDLAQETFLRLYRQRFAGDREHYVRAWLFRVATNLAYNALRGRRHLEQRETVATLREPPGADQEMDPVRWAERSEARQEVRRALAELPARQAQLLLLRHAGLSYRELAAALEVAPGSVGTLLARATTAFQEAYRRQSHLSGRGEGDEM